MKSLGLGLPIIEVVDLREDMEVVPTVFPELKDKGWVVARGRGLTACFMGRDSWMCAEDTPEGQNNQNNMNDAASHGELLLLSSRQRLLKMKLLPMSWPGVC